MKKILIITPTKLIADTTRPAIVGAIVTYFSASKIVSNRIEPNSIEFIPKAIEWKTTNIIEPLIFCITYPFL